MNLCRSCSLDFGSLWAFDAHRVGKHAYTYLEGLDMDPPCEDGRRCLTEPEMTAAGWNRGSSGRWRTPSRVAVSARRGAQDALKRVRRGS